MYLCVYVRTYFCLYECKYCTCTIFKTYTYLNTIISLQPHHVAYNKNVSMSFFNFCFLHMKTFISCMNQYLQMSYYQHMDHCILNPPICFLPNHIDASMYFMCLCMYAWSACIYAWNPGCERQLKHLCLHRDVRPHGCLEGLHAYVHVHIVGVHPVTFVWLRISVCKIVTIQLFLEMRSYLSWYKWVICDASNVSNFHMYAHSF